MYEKAKDLVTVTLVKVKEANDEEIWENIDVTVERTWNVDRGSYTIKPWDYPIDTTYELDSFKIIEMEPTVQLTKEDNDNLWELCKDEPFGKDSIHWYEETY